MFVVTKTMLARKMLRSVYHYYLLTPRVHQLLVFQSAHYKSHFPVTDNHRVFSPIIISLDNLDNTIKSEGAK